MLSPRPYVFLNVLTKCSSFHIVRALTTQKIDPIQKAFADLISEYGKKSKGAEFGLAEAVPGEIKNLKEMLAKVDNTYGAVGRDMTKFPSFNFEDKPLAYPGSSIFVDKPNIEIEEEQVAESKHHAVEDDGETFRITDHHTHEERIVLRPAPYRVENFRVIRF